MLIETNNKNVKSPTQFCLESIPNGFGAAESKEVPLKRNEFDF